LKRTLAQANSAIRDQWPTQTPQSQPSEVVDHAIRQQAQQYLEAQIRQAEFAVQRQLQQPAGYTTQQPGGPGGYTQQPAGYMQQPAQIQQPELAAHQQLQQPAGYTQQPGGPGSYTWQPGLWAGHAVAGLSSSSTGQTGVELVEASLRQVLALKAQAKALRQQQPDKAAAPAPKDPKDVSLEAEWKSGEWVAEPKPPASAASKPAQAQATKPPRRSPIQCFNCRNETYWGRGCGCWTESCKSYRWPKKDRAILCVGGDGGWESQGVRCIVM
jgi:hypothetical protein